MFLNPFDTYEFQIAKYICTSFKDWESRHVFVDLTTETNNYGPFNSGNKISNITFHTKNYTLKVTNDGPNIENFRLCFHLVSTDDKYVGNEIYPFKYNGVYENSWQNYVYVMVGVLASITIIIFISYLCCEKCSI